jgi:hypothetical protein
MLATFLAASIIGTSLGSLKLVEFDPSTGDALRVVTKTSGGSRYSQWTVLQVDDLSNPRNSETYSFREFSMGNNANMIHRASVNTWFKFDGDMGRVLESIRSEHVAERPLTVEESVFRGKVESQVVQHKEIYWKDGRVTEATVMIELSKEPKFEFQRITKGGRTLSLLSRVDSGNVVFPNPASEAKEVATSEVKKWLSPFAEILYPATIRADLRGKSAAAF